jgi:capsular exopolysaccharide synthesis family protein
VHGNLGLGNDRGLSNYLAGSEAIGPLLQRPDGEPMAVLTAGPQPPNAAELLRSPRFAALLAELRANFDHIVIDSPPVMGLADAPTVASQAEGTVFVIESRSVKERVARRALDRLRQGRAHIIGAVLTRFDPRRAHLGYDYGYGYGYGSSYGDNAPTRKPA